MTSYFAPEVAKYHKSSLNPEIAQNSVRVYCLAPFAMQLFTYLHTLNPGLRVPTAGLLHSVSDRLVTCCAAVSVSRLSEMATMTVFCVAAGSNVASISEVVGRLRCIHYAVQG